MVVNVFKSQFTVTKPVSISPTSFVCLPILPEVMVQLNVTPYISLYRIHPKDSILSREDVQHRKTPTWNGSGNKIRTS